MNKYTNVAPRVNSNNNSRAGSRASNRSRSDRLNNSFSHPYRPSSAAPPRAKKDTLNTSVAIWERERWYSREMNAIFVAKLKIYISLNLKSEIEVDLMFIGFLSGHIWIIQTLFKLIFGVFYILHEKINIVIQINVIINYLFWYETVIYTHKSCFISYYNLCLTKDIANFYHVLERLKNFLTYSLL